MVVHAAFAMAKSTHDAVTATSPDHERRYAIFNRSLLLLSRSISKSFLTHSDASERICGHIDLLRSKRDLLKRNRPRSKRDQFKFLF
jgi:hypothetical protein